MAQRGGKRPGAGRKKANHTIEAEQSRAYLIKRLHEELEPIVDKALEQAKSGDKHARDWLSERAWGKPAQAVEVSGKGGDPIAITISEAVAKKNNIAV
jgi:hypothetical protein